MTSVSIRRRVGSAVGTAAAAACAGISATLLLIILITVVVQGAGGVRPELFFQLPHPIGVAGGGLANGIVGTAIILTIAAFVATPIGVLCGVFLAVFSRGLVGPAMRFLADVLSGIPSVVIGLFAYTALVAPMRHFSAFSAAFAFAILMLPIVVRASDEAIRSVPSTVRDGALALGMSTTRATLYVVLPTARRAIVTGLLLALARVTGETAPLLFTAFGSQYLQFNPLEPMAELSLQVFTYAISPYDDWHRQAWAGALLLVLAVLVVNGLARLALRRRES